MVTWLWRILRRRPPPRGPRPDGGPDRGVPSQVQGLGGQPAEAGRPGEGGARARRGALELPLLLETGRRNDNSRRAGTLRLLRG